MCGICGVWYFGTNQSVDPAFLRTMTNELIHRGPDDGDIYCAGSVGLGFRRLFIIDALTGRQPLSNEDGRIWIVCNGEIYNFPALRKILENHHAFKTNGDIEAILHLYEDRSMRCVDHLRGMFAFAIWDKRFHQLHLAVDRFGKKPLYYHVDQEKIVFASELKTLLRHPDISLTLDYDALDEYFSSGYISAPRSIFATIRKLEPGHFITMSEDGHLQRERYWQPTFAASGCWSERSLDDLAAELRTLLLDAVCVRMNADVPIGAFLSGGIDSSAVVALMSQVSGTPIKTFSVGFDDPSYDERNNAQTLADYCDSDHHCLIVQPEDALNALPQLIHQFDEPFADASMIPTYLLAHFARQRVTVALSGDGGDEVFAGYNQHLYGYRQYFLQSIIPASLHPVAAQLAKAFPPAFKLKPYLAAIEQPASFWKAGNGFFSPQQRSRLYTAAAHQRLRDSPHEHVKMEIFRRVRHLDGLSQLQYHDLSRYLPGDILVKIDRAAMLTSLEMRCPLLDHHIFEFMAQVPPGYRVGLKTGKVLLKKALGTLLPPTIQRRSKQGFSIPQAEWLRGSLYPLLRDVLLDLHNPDLFDPNFVKWLLDEHMSGQADHKDRLWALLCFELWSRNYGVKVCL